MVQVYAVWESKVSIFWVEHSWVPSPVVCFRQVLPLDYPLKSYSGSMSGKMQTGRLWTLANQGIKKSPSHRGSSRSSVHLSGCPPWPAAPPCSCTPHPHPTGCEGRKLETQQDDPLYPKHHSSFLSLCPSSLSFPCSPNFHSSLSLLKEDQSGFLPLYALTS